MVPDFQTIYSTTWETLKKAQKANLSCSETSSEGRLQNATGIKDLPEQTVDIDWKEVTTELIILHPANWVVHLDGKKEWDTIP
jgi:hypothetical protein